MNHISPLKIVFAGTPAFAVPCLQALLQAGHSIVQVYTQPDRPAGRGLKLTESPVKQAAMAAGLAIHQPQTLRNDEEIHFLQALQPDVMVVVAYGLILPPSILAIPRLGCINVHASLLPKWRGAAPIQRALLAGDAQTGISIMQMEAGLDTGPVWLQATCPIQNVETSLSLHDRLADLGAKALLDAMPLIVQVRIKPQVQASTLATYAEKIQKSEALLQWHLPAEQLEKQVRAFNPWPVAYTRLNETILRIWRAEVIKNDMQSLPGTIIQMDQQGVDVATGQGSLRLLEVQLPGGKVSPVQNLLQNKSVELHVGARFSI